MDANAWVTGTNILLTFGLLVFAYMQWRVTDKAEERERRHQDEAREEEANRLERQRHQAYQFVWAEHFGLFSLAEYWRESSLLDLALTDGLRAEYVEIRDSDEVLQALTQLSPEAGYLGAAAITLSHEVVREISEFNGVVNGWRAQFQQKQHDYLNILSLTKQNLGRSMDGREAIIKQRVSEMATLLLDALKQSGEADKQRQLSFKADVESAYAREAISLLGERARAPTSKRV